MKLKTDKEALSSLPYNSSTLYNNEVVKILESSPAARKNLIEQYLLTLE
jgi:hypothetical protein